MLHRCEAYIQLLEEALEYTHQNLDAELQKNDLDEGKTSGAQTQETQTQENSQHVLNKNMRQK